MDIRNFFKSGSLKKCKQTSESSDESPDRSTARTRRQTAERKRMRIISSDSDEDFVTNKSQKQKIPATQQSSTTQEERKNKPSAKAKMVSITAEEFFTKKTVANSESDNTESEICLDLETSKNTAENADEKSTASDVKRAKKRLSSNEVICDDIKTTRKTESKKPAHGTKNSKTMDVKRKATSSTSTEAVDNDGEGSEDSSAGVTKKRTSLNVEQYGNQENISIDVDMNTAENADEKSTASDVKRAKKRLSSNEVICDDIKTTRKTESKKPAHGTKNSKTMDVKRKATSSTSTEAVDNDGEGSVDSSAGVTKKRTSLNVEQYGNQENISIDVDMKSSTVKKCSTTLSIQEPIKRLRISVSGDVPRDDHKTMSSAHAANIELGSFVPHMMWADKHRPTEVGQIVGQQGASSCMSKLLAWLESWNDKNSNSNACGKKQPAKTYSRSEGEIKKAALLSGPPGVGKTTTAHLCCKHLGISVLEFNASDTRSKKLLEDEFRNASTSTSISISCPFAAPRICSKRCIIMDEVDGMSGNEDRGGMQELIAIIKKSSVPIICICNDRQHPKIRSLANYCLDIRFQKLRSEQIKAKLRTVLFREKKRIDNISLEEIVSSCAGDMRQALHILEMWYSGEPSNTESSPVAKKNIVLNPFEVCRQIFLPELYNRPITISDRSDMFFNDYSLMPLFVQENYLSVAPVLSGNKHELLHKMADAANLIAESDVVSATLHSTNQWSLLKTVSMLSAALPCELMKGRMKSMINFPAWFGKRSKFGRIQRQLDETLSHCRVKVQVGRKDFRLDVAPSLLDIVFGPLQLNSQAGIHSACQRAFSLYLQRADLDYLAEVVVGTVPKLDSKLKATFTRGMNHSIPVYPYQLRPTTTSRSGAVGGKRRADDVQFLGDGPDLDDGEREDSDELMSDKDDEDFTLDRNIKLRKGKGSNEKAKSQSKQTKSKRVKLK